MARESVKGDFYPGDEPGSGEWLPENGKVKAISWLLWVVGCLEFLFAFVGNFLIMTSNGPFRIAMALESIIGHVAIGLICIGLAEGLRVLVSRPSE